MQALSVDHIPIVLRHFHDRVRVNEDALNQLDTPRFGLWGDKDTGSNIVRALDATMPVESLSQLADAYKNVAKGNINLFLCETWRVLAKAWEGLSEIDGAAYMDALGRVNENALVLWGPKARRRGTVLEVIAAAATADPVDGFHGIGSVACAASSAAGQVARRNSGGRALCHLLDVFAEVAT